LACSSLASYQHSDPYSNVPVYKKEEHGYQGGQHSSEIEDVRIFELFIKFDLKK
jgi:hypothetical protein